MSSILLRVTTIKGEAKFYLFFFPLYYTTSVPKYKTLLTNSYPLRKSWLIYFISIKFVTNLYYFFKITPKVIGTNRLILSIEVFPT